MIETEFKDLVNDVSKRFELVSRRLEALKLEQETLSAESVQLSALLNIYKGREYDSISEERAVTEHITKPNTRVSRKQSAKSSEYEDTMLMMFQNANAPMTFSDIERTMEKILGREISNGVLSFWRDRLISLGKIYVIDPGNRHKQYCITPVNHES